MTATKRSISIYRDNVWAGIGVISNGCISDCGAVLAADDSQDDSDTTYELIE